MSSKIFKKIKENFSRKKQEKKTPAPAGWEWVYSHNQAFLADKLDIGSFSKQPWLLLDECGKILEEHGVPYFVSNTGDEPILNIELENLTEALNALKTTKHKGLNLHLYGRTPTWTFKIEDAPDNLDEWLDTNHRLKLFRFHKKDAYVTGSRYGLVVNLWKDHNLDLVSINKTGYTRSIGVSEQQPSVYVNEYSRTEHPSWVDSCISEPEKVTDPVDLVWLWVDAGDRNWQERCAKRCLETGVKPPEFKIHRQFNELQYAMRGAQYYMPWVRNTYLVTDQQIPDWLDTASGIKMVSHEELFSKYHGKSVYNSHALMSQIHNIPGISENMLIMNDDVFIANTSYKKDWFSSSGKALYYNSTTLLPSRSSQDSAPALYQARWNAIDLVKKTHGFQPKLLFKHLPISLKKSYMLELEDRFPEEFKKTAGSLFRDPRDIETVWLHHYMGLKENATDHGKSAMEYAYVATDAANLEGSLNKLYSGSTAKHRVFCINEGPGNAVVEHEVQETLTNFFESKFPIPSTFEKPSIV